MRKGGISAELNDVKWQAINERGGAFQAEEARAKTLAHEHAWLF